MLQRRATTVQDFIMVSPGLALQWQCQSRCNRSEEAPICSKPRIAAVGERKYSHDTEILHNVRWRAVDVFCQPRSTNHADHFQQQSNEQPVVEPCFESEVLKESVARNAAKKHCKDNGGGCGRTVRVKRRLRSSSQYSCRGRIMYEDCTADLLGHLGSTSRPLPMMKCDDVNK